MTSKTRQCLHCGKSTFNPKFCGRSCSASYNNHKNPKRFLTNVCKLCDTKISQKVTYCKTCYANKAKGRGDMPLYDAIKLYSKHHKSSAFALVRTRARQVAKKLNYNKCAKCGYGKHVEIAHIKAISTFDLSTLISVVNSPDNLMPLCPNCHWELDHKL